MIKKVTVLPQKIIQKKNLANKKAIFECKIINIKIPKKNKLDDDFAKKLRS